MWLMVDIGKNLFILSVVGIYPGYLTTRTQPAQWVVDWALLAYRMAQKEGGVSPKGDAQRNTRFVLIISNLVN